MLGAIGAGFAVGKPAPGRQGAERERPQVGAEPGAAASGAAPSRGNAGMWREGVPRFPLLHCYSPAGTGSALRAGEEETSLGSAP